MNRNSHTVLHFNLENQSSEIKNHTELAEFLGGYGIGLKLLEQNLEADPLIFSIGPLTAAFPYASKTCVAAAQEQIQSSYVGGGLGAALKFAGLDALVIKGKSLAPLYILIKDQEVSFHKSAEESWKAESFLGQVSFLESAKEPLVDQYFKFSGTWLGENLASRNLKAVVVSGTKSIPIENSESYQKVFKELLSRVAEVETAAANNKSCFACPLGGEHSFEGDKFPDRSLSQFLVSCHFASKIYEDIPTVFACLNALGYSWSHEALEKLPGNAIKLREEIDNRIQVSKRETGN